MTPERKYEEYHLLSPDGETSSDSQPQRRGDYSTTQPSFTHSKGWRSIFLLLLIALSLLLGFLVGSYIPSSNTKNGLSSYLQLGFTQSTHLWWNTEYSSQNASEEELDKLWDSTIPWESGIIALTWEEAREMHLPESQPFPWDSKEKGIYIVNAHHILHCVRNIYISIQQYRKNETQTINYPHILHCLDSLRVETMCNADDTLRYVPLNSAHGYRPGDGQSRKCRDWSQVQKFVGAHDPCYRYLEPGNNELSNLERFKFCPSDSPYLPKIRQYFGYDDDWVPQPQEGPRELQW
ncbi:hypothetical protein F4805DRAFT_442653 [Annulohypoxylon moriforme]|nr:hypothetical protein F4805DRAFT_442653 [Annulohypoxylon moriforme]